jgi:RsiW-degrading membrane proteinase PrsW (M82 family)
MHVLSSALLAILPALLLLHYFYKRDVHPEPRGVLFKTFLLGILAVIPVMVVALPAMWLAPVGWHPVLLGLYMAFVCAAIPEEYFKFLVVTRYSARHPAFDEPMDGVVYGATASLGFATAENILYVLQGGWTLAIARGLTAVPCHACLGAILGYFVGQARFRPHSGIAAWHGYLVAVLLHGLYDFPLLTILQMESQGMLGEEAPWNDALAGGLLLTFLFVFVGVIMWTRRIVRRLHNEQMRESPSAATVESLLQ